MLLAPRSSGMNCDRGKDKILFFPYRSVVGIRAIATQICLSLLPSNCYLEAVPEVLSFSRSCCPHSLSLISRMTTTLNACLDLLTRRAQVA